MLGNHPQVADYVKVEEEARKERVRTTSIRIYVSAATSVRIIWVVQITWTLMV